MRVNGVRCDECSKEHLFSDTGYIASGIVGDIVPPSWFVVARGGSLVHKEPWMFCSRDCLRRHPLTIAEEER